MADDHFTTGDIARLLKVSAVTVFRAIKNGQLKASTTPGGHYRVSRADLEAYMKRNNIPVPAPGPEMKRILIVEDNKAELRSYQRSLEREPRFIIKTADSGYAAGLLTRSFRPDLILLDVFLGEVDGCEIVRLIRSDPALKGTKIAAVTGFADAAELKRIRESGVDTLIEKPVAPDELVRLAKKLLE